MSTDLDTCRSCRILRNYLTPYGGFAAVLRPVHRLRAVATHLPPRYLASISLLARALGYTYQRDSGGILDVGIFLGVVARIISSDCFWVQLGFANLCRCIDCGLDLLCSEGETYIQGPGDGGCWEERTRGVDRGPAQICSRKSE